MMIGIECNQRTGEIRDVLAQGEIAFHVEKSSMLVQVVGPGSAGGAFVTMLPRSAAYVAPLHSRTRRPVS